MIAEDVTVFVPAKNARRTIGACVESVLAQTVRPFEVIVVDDGSSDETSLEARRFPVRLIAHSLNRGIAAARNTAVSAAKTKWVAALDSDCAAEPPWLEKLLDAAGRENAAGAGGMLVEGGRPASNRAWRAAHLAQHWGDKTVLNPRFLFGCNTLFLREALNAIGGYDERFRRNAEDWDMSRRLLAAGHRLVYEPSARVRHLRGDSLMSLLDSYWGFHYFAFRTAPTPAALLKALMTDLRTSPSMIRKDLFSGRPDFVIADALVGPYSMLRDLLASAGI